MIDLQTIYKDLLNKDALEYDESQFNAIEILNSLRIQILQSFRKKNKQSILRYFFSPIFSPGFFSFFTFDDFLMFSFRGVVVSTPQTFFPTPFFGQFGGEKQ